jgi:hypothetical protein
MDSGKRKRDGSFEEDLEKPLLVEQSYTFDDREGLKSTEA